VQNNWGGPDSADKRDWFAGAVADLFPDVSRLTPAQLALKAQQLSQNQSQSQSQSQSQQQNGTAAAEEPDQEDVETVLLQVMLDEFEVNVDDDSAWEVAETVVRLRSECLKGKFEGVEELRRRWEARKGDKVVFKKAENEDDDDDEDSEEDDSDEGEDADGDVEMDDAAPQLVNTRKEPEVDEDGFIKVSRRRK
jgi:pre-rRNA-processing protein TSR2